MRRLRFSEIRPAAAVSAALLITLYGGLLRLDAFTGKYGTLDRPGWARLMTHDVAPIAWELRPSHVTWTRVQRPYVGGDPIAYLTYARAMESFYQPRLREPGFVTLTRVSLWLLGHQDAAVSLASAIGSMLAIFATYLLGAALISPLGGLAAAFVMAIDYQLIIWSVDGWRDDTFTASVLFAAWGFLRLRSRPTFGNALIAGFAASAPCLTRITALSFVLPALLWLVIDGARPLWRERARHAATTLLILAVVVAPYLITCAIATGDPFVAINHHTTYYREAERLPGSDPMNAGEYIRSKFARRPVATFDTGVTGLFVHPFRTKWGGLDIWMPGQGPVLSWLALAGLAALPFSAAGRLLLVILFCSLLPVAFTWNLGDGGSWRFTMHAYPFYLVAAVYALAGVCRAVVAVVRDPARASRSTVVPIARRAAAVLAIAALAGVGYLALPWFVTREAIVNGDSVSVGTGARDLVFYRSGWSPPHNDGITVRVSRGERSSVHFPLPAKRAYEIVLRLDPVAPSSQDRVTVLFNRKLAGLIHLKWSPERVGSYRLALPEHMVRAGSNELTLVPESIVTAGAAGPRFAWLDPAEKIGVRLWYVRVVR
jgi:4-amino-4-deoxy-L-arabinose transferase-like glycosyltransferase